MALAGHRLGELVASLAARTPTPGGGAAAAAAAALGCAAGAMAARYTTGPKWADRSAEAEALAHTLDKAATAVLHLADADEAAFAAAQAARKAGDGAAALAADAKAAAVPLDVIRICAACGDDLATFLPQCNPRLVSDVKVGIHLLAGAARAAWATMQANAPGPAVEIEARALLARLGVAEEACA